MCACMVLVLSFRSLVVPPAQVLQFPGPFGDDPDVWMLCSVHNLGFGMYFCRLGVGTSRYYNVLVDLGMSVLLLGFGCRRDVGVSLCERI